MNEARKLNKQMKAQIVRLFVGALKEESEEQKLITTFSDAVQEFQTQEAVLESDPEICAIMENQKILTEMQHFLTAHENHAQAEKAAALNRMIASVDDWVGFPFMQRLLDSLNDSEDETED